MRMNGKYIRCLCCEKEFYIPKYRFKSAKYCSISCGSKSNPIDQTKVKRNYGNKHPRWKDGKTRRKDGYILIQVRGNRFYEHRYVMETFLGRKLNPGECIHHINHDRGDNRLENLEVLSRSEHTKRYHIKGRDF